MARRIAAVSILTAASAVGLAVACVDLFHSTDFKTLCTEKPDDPQCGGSGTPDGGSDAGTDAPAKPPIDLCSLTSPQVKERAVKACAFLGACGVSTGKTAFGDCVRRAMFAMDCAGNPTLRPRGEAEKLWQCLAEIASCKDVEQCVFGGPPQKCAGPGPFSACSAPSVAGGNVRIECDSQSAVEGVEPCLATNQRCATVIKNSVAACRGAVDGCTESKCQGTNAVVCDVGPKIDNGFDCANVGAGTCFDTPGVGPACVPRGTASTPCEDGGAATALAICDDAGVAARACVDGNQVVMNCDRLGLECDGNVTALTHDPGALCVVRLGCSETTDTCADEDLHGCNRGADYVAKCTALGLGKCAEVNGRANCTKP